MKKKFVLLLIALAACILFTSCSSGWLCQKRYVNNKQLQQCSSYEDMLESLEERELKEPHTIEELVELFSDTSQNLFLVLEEHEIQL